MALDDANDSRGAAGECPGHDWELAELDVLQGGGAGLVMKCRYCEAVSYERSARHEPNRPSL